MATTNGGCDRCNLEFWLVVYLPNLVYVGILTEYYSVPTVYFRCVCIVSEIIHWLCINNFECVSYVFHMAPTNSDIFFHHNFSFQHAGKHLTIPSCMRRLIKKKERQRSRYTHTHSVPKTRTEMLQHHELSLPLSHNNQYIHRFFRIYRSHQHTSIQFCDRTEHIVAFNKNWKTSTMIPRLYWAAYQSSMVSLHTFGLLLCVQFKTWKPKPKPMNIRWPEQCLFPACSKKQLIIINVSVYSCIFSWLL